MIDKIIDPGNIIRDIKNRHNDFIKVSSEGRVINR